MNAKLPLRVCLGALALFSLIGLWRCIAIAGLHVPLDPNEGWNAYHALHAMSGGPLYPQRDSFLFNNYPPLSFYVVGTLGSLIGDNIVAGRIASLLATLGLTAGIYFAARRMQAGMVAALFAALIFVAGLLIFTDYVGMDDPQMLGHAAAICGLIVLLKEPRTKSAAAVAAMLLALAVFIKHNLVALPAALTLWLAIFDRRNAMPFAGVGIAIGVMGLSGFEIAFGRDLFGVLNSARTYSFGLLAGNVGNWLLWADVPLSGLVALLWLRRTDRFVVLCAFYAAMGIAVGIAFSGGAGVDMNIWFDGMIALSLAAALVVDRLPRTVWVRGVVAGAYILPLIAGIALNWDDVWLTRGFWLRPMADETTTAQSDIAFLKARPGPVACEMLSLCYWAGKPEEIDMFNLGQAYAAHRRSDEALVRLIGAKHYGAMEFDSLDDFALTPQLKRTLLKSYRVDHANDEGVFLVPR